MDRAGGDGGGAAGESKRGHFTGIPLCAPGALPPPHRQLKAGLLVSNHLLQYCMKNQAQLVRPEPRARSGHTVHTVPHPRPSPPWKNTGGVWVILPSRSLGDELASHLGSVSAAAHGEFHDPPKPPASSVIATSKWSYTGTYSHMHRCTHSHRHTCVHYSNSMTFLGK